MKEKRKSDFFESSSKRRQSLFDTKPEESHFTMVESKLEYPVEYKQRVKREIEEWKSHVIKALDEKRKFKQKKELKSKLLDESILSTEQLDFLGAINFNNYMNIAQHFCVKFAIRNRQIFYDIDNIKELEEHSADLQKKIQAEVFGKVSGFSNN